MESESSHSLPNPSETPNTPESETNEISTSRKRTRAASTKPPKIPKQPRSPYWGHCQRGTRKLSDGSLEEIGICNYCKAEIPVTYGSTSGLKTHLVRRCKSSPLYEESLSEKTQQILTSESMGQGSTLVSHMFNQKRSELKVAEWVIVDEMSFRAVEGKGFVSLVRELQPRFRIPGRKKIAVLSIVVDNASSNETAIDYLKKRMKSKKTLFLDGKYLHLRCACHILNLIVKDGLKELNAAIKSIRNTVVFIHSSPSRLSKFRDFAVLESFPSGSTIHMDVKTRWNSTYKMLVVALKYKRIFDRMAKEWVPYMNYFSEKIEKGKEMIGPSNEGNWEDAKAFVHFLKRFYDSTLDLSASKTPTSQMIYQSMIAIQIEIEKKVKDESDKVLQKVAKTMKMKFDKYCGNWNELNPMIFIANVLDPRNKLQMVKATYDKLGGTSTSDEAFFENVKKSLVTLWAEYKKMSDTLNVEGQNMQMECDGGNTSGGGGGCDDDIYADVLGFVDAQNEKEQLQEISNEVEKFFADEIEKRSNTSFNLLEWWKASGSRYPVLTLIAKDIFAIPSSTIASESAFSLGKRIVDPFRSSLSPKMVEALVCTNDWLRAEGINFYKDPTDDDLDLYKEIEEIERWLNAIQESSLATTTNLT